MFDLIISGGRIADGTGRPAYAADIAVSGGRIAAIGDLRGEAAKETLDAVGLIVAPGFIDAHAHSDTCFLKDGCGASKLFQGITTEVTGQCGMSPFPSGQYESFDALARALEESAGMAVNQAILCGHGSLRAAAVGLEDRLAAPQEIKKMQALLARELEGYSEYMQKVRYRLIPFVW